MGFWSKLFGGKRQEQPAISPEELFARQCLEVAREQPLVVRVEQAPGDEQALLIWKAGDDEFSQKVFLRNPEPIWPR